MQINKIILILLLITSFASCQPKEKFDWEVGLSAPKNFGASGCYTRFYYKGKSVGSASANIGIQPGWGETAGGFASGKEEDEVPDSLTVNWDCSVDMVNYELKTKLPRNKMLKLFQKEVKNLNGLSREYSLIIVGMAPGGNVTLWMRAGSILTEIAKFKADEIKKINPYDDSRISLWSSTGEQAKDIFKYLFVHGIDYKVWEKGEKEYNYDVGFTSQDGNIKMSLLTFFSKAGTVFQPDTYSETPFTIDKSQWSKVSYQVNNNIIKKESLPIMMRVQIKNKLNPKLYYATDVILPVNFENIYAKKYLDSITNNKENYNRIVIGIYSDCTKGIVYLEGKNKRIKISEFKCFLPKMEGTTYKSGGYSLPKNFEFPKWEGREKLIKPDLEFWQEK